MVVFFSLIRIEFIEFICGIIDLIVMMKLLWMCKICMRLRLGFVSFLLFVFGVLIIYFFRVFLVELGLCYDDLYDEMYDFDIMEVLYCLFI